MTEYLYDMLATKFPTQRKVDQVAKLDEQDVVLNVVPLQMIIPVDVPKARAKDTEIKNEKSPKGKSMQSKAIENTSLKIKLLHSSDFETNVEEDVQDIMSTIRRKAGGKRIYVIVPITPMDNVPFHSDKLFISGNMCFREGLLPRKS